METLYISILGTFTLRIGDRVISDNDNRTKKCWLLLAFLLCHKNRCISSQELIRLLWGDSPFSTNPENTLRITIHRLRAMLDLLWPSAGHDLILYKDFGYSWNTSFPLFLDYEYFEQLCCTKTTDHTLRLQCCLEALHLYQGDFLEKRSTEDWVVPICTHYRNLFLAISMEAASLLSFQKRHQEAITICRTALSYEPYHEPLFQTLMQELSALGDSQGLIDAFSKLRKRLWNDFCLSPTEETKAVYRSALLAADCKILTIDNILEDTQKKWESPGAIPCDYDVFRILCRMKSNSPERGNGTYVVLLSVNVTSARSLSKTAQEHIMQWLAEHLHKNLHRWDIFSRCSNTQYVLLLQDTGYENSRSLCLHTLSSFQHQYPDVPVELSFGILSLTDNAPSS